MNALGCGEILEPVLAEIAQLELDRGGRRCRDEHLAAPAGSSDPGGAVDVASDVALVGKERRARVDPGADLDQPRGERLCEGGGGSERAGSGREGEEEGVSLRVDLDPPLRCAGLADHTPVL